MPAAMYLTVLMSLFAVTVCKDTATSTTTQVSGLTNGVTTHPQPTTTTHQISTEITSHKVSPPLSTSPQTPKRTEVTHVSPRPQTTNQTSNETVFKGSTVPAASESPNITATTTINITNPAFPHKWGKDDFLANPGLVAIICIFCIVIVLVLVVATVKCTRSSKSNFERLEDVPMGKMSEKSPFAQYSK
ncbi:hypothetical protein PAMP_024236 [Pampus punctatissimus]